VYVAAIIKRTNEMTKEFSLEFCSVVAISVFHAERQRKTNERNDYSRYVFRQNGLGIQKVGQNNALQKNYE